MLAIRYVTLAALVVWLGGLVTVALLMAPTADELRQLELVGYACGATILVCLLVLKFVGPPPHDFFPRIGLVAMMLLVALYAGVRSPTFSIVNIALGGVLLSWYVRE